MIKELIIDAFCCFWLSSCLQEQEIKNYEVQAKELANFSVLSQELYPEVKLNRELVFEAGNDTTPSFSFWKHFSFPDSIGVIEVNTYYKGENKKMYNDTLVNANSQSVIIPAPFPKE